MSSKDAIGNAIWDYYTNNNPGDILVESDLTEDDFLPIKHLFRNYEDFPKLEAKAMQYCKGKTLDVGAGAGPHTKHLLQKGFDVSTIEVSPLAHRYLKEEIPEVNHFSTPILDFTGGIYDTVLLLMNGIGLAETLKGVVPFLKHVSTLLTPNGSILCDSTDVQNIFEDDEGALWVDLNSNYYGEFKFNMKYKKFESGWFNWVYLDLNKFKELANEAGLTLDLLEEDDNSFLVQLKKQ